jgi:4-hydroxy-2-oxoheptanedioate aldolase
MLPTANEFAARLRRRERILGYWSVMDCPIATEWVAHVGWDYIALDLQHGVIDYHGMVAGLTAIDSAAGPVGLVRVEANNPTPIARALDAGAAGVIVPPLNTGAEAAQAVASATYPPNGIRSNGGIRAQLRIGPLPADADRDTLVLTMIETSQGLANVEEIAATPGLDGVYVGPSDLRMALGSAHPQDPAVDKRIRSRTQPDPAGRGRNGHRCQHPYSGRRDRGAQTRRGLQFRLGRLRSGPPQGGLRRSSQGRTVACGRPWTN